jgi:MscS family membrane protein
MLLSDLLGFLIGVMTARGTRDALPARRATSSGEDREVHMAPKLTATMLVLSVMLASPAFGQTPGAPTPKRPPEAAPASLDPLGRDTPRGTVLGFIKAANAGNIKRAAEYLDARRFPKQAEQRALELKAVMDRGVSPKDLDHLSNQPEGELDDDLSPGLDRVATVKTDAGPLDLQLERVREGKNPPIWLVSAATLKRIPAAYEEIRPLWVERFMWPPLREIRFLDVPLWRWILLPLALALALVVTWLLSRALVVTWLLSRALFAVLSPCWSG